MTSKKWAISKEAEALALRYGSNVSQGIREMGRLLAFMKAEDARKVKRALREG